MQRGFSPRPWGWSVENSGKLDTLTVFPTPVGMVRDLLPDGSGCGCFPHARGDGPRRGDRHDRCPEFSPRPWGWSALHHRGFRNRGVFPTPVGMVRFSRFATGAFMRFPHARGDGPLCRKKTQRNRKFSPRPWGWSGETDPRELSLLVFPTPVGMVRCEFGFPHIFASFPHARGDGPTVKTVKTINSKFSPRPWGWSDLSGLSATRFLVFPTPVGMVRILAETTFEFNSFPHARGDGPQSYLPPPSVATFSPRPWGWSVSQNMRFLLVNVFPTPVGMVRSFALVVKCCAGFPHARGDGPYHSDQQTISRLFSPRPWGWSVPSAFPRDRPFVFPTPVGMVRSSPPIE